MVSQESCDQHQSGHLPERLLQSPKEKQPCYNQADFFSRSLKHVILFLTSDSYSCCFLFLEYCFHAFYMTNFYLYFHISPLIAN